MAPPTPDREPRYRRRILTVGALATFALLVVGGPIFSNRIEDDLERRVPAELAAAGVGDVTARFSGQDGVLSCTQPLDDPEAAVDMAYDVWGVRKIELERSCRVNRAPIVETTTTAAVAAEASVTDPVVDVDSTEPSAETTVPADFGSIAEIVSSSGELALLSVLLGEADLAGEFSDPTAGPFTLFAPTDEAFDAVPADTLAQLRSDPALLRRVLEHHTVLGAFTAAELEPGELGTLDGGVVDITTSGGSTRVDGGQLGAPDLKAANGIVHVIDRVLVPSDIDLRPPASPAEVAITFADDAMTLRGVVASEVERAAIVNAAAAVVATVVDELTVDPDIGLDSATSGTLAAVVSAVPLHLVAATTGFDGEAVYVRGAAATEADLGAMLAVTEPLGVVADLVVRPEVDPGVAAAELEAALNEFVIANPIVFEQASALLSPSAAPVLDRIAADVAQLDVALTVEGHTDSDGTPEDNLVLSTERAEAVRQALIARGVSADRVTAEGFGSERPIIVDGVEDKAASRRVEFRVVAA